MWNASTVRMERFRAEGTTFRLIVAVLACSAALAATAQAQNDKMTPIATPVAAECH